MHDDPTLSIAVLGNVVLLPILGHFGESGTNNLRSILATENFISQMIDAANRGDEERFDAAVHTSAAGFDASFSANWLRFA